MRNKGKQASPFRWMLKRYFFLFVAVFLISFAVFPMQGMMRVLSTGRGLALQEGPMDPRDRLFYIRQLTLNFVYSPMNLEMLCLLFGGMGFGAAMVLFRHLFSRRQALMAAGLPMTRPRIFRLRVQTYGVLCLLPLAVCLAIHPLVVWGNGMWDLFLPGTYALRACTVLLINLYGFVLGAFCASVFGTVWSAALGGMALAVSVEAALYCWTMMAGNYLSSLYVYDTRRRLLRFSPAYSLYKGFYQPGEFTLAPGILAILLLGVLAFLAYRGAKPENAGQALNRKRAEPVVLAWATVLGGTAGAVVLSLYLSQEAILYAGLILGAAAGWVLARMLLDQRVRLSTRLWQVPAAATAAMLLALLGLRMDWAGYNAYTARPEALEAVRVWPGLSKREEISFDDPEGIEACLAWVGQMREETLEAHRKAPYKPGEYPDVAVLFQGRDGKETVRVYEYAENRAETLPALKTMAEKYIRQRAEKISELPRVNAYAGFSNFGFYGETFRETYGFSTDSQRIRRPDADQVREALRQDLRERTLETMQEPTLLRVSFEGTDPETGEYEYDVLSYSIKPDDRRSVELLLGEEAEKWIDYVRGGFARSGEIHVFLCNYVQDDRGEWKLGDYRMAESEEEAREWLSRVAWGADYFFGWPKDPAHRVQIYSMESLRNMMEYQENLDLDLEDPEVIRTLPENENVSGSTYEWMAN